MIIIKIDNFEYKKFYNANSLSNIKELKRSIIQQISD